MQIRMRNPGEGRSTRSDRGCEFVYDNDPGTRAIRKPGDGMDAIDFLISAFTGEPAAAQHACADDARSLRETASGHLLR